MKDVKEFKDIFPKRLKDLFLKRYHMNVEKMLQIKDFELKEDL
jgi:hypothetical protein